MAISINNSVANINGTPGAASGVFNDRPAAADVADGTLYFATDTVAIYQTVAGSWVNYSGGGGGTPGIDTVLSQNQIFTNDRLINTNNFEFIINSLKQLTLQSNTTLTSLKIEENLIKTRSNTNGDTGLFLNFAANISVLGDWGNTNNKTNLIVDDTASYVYTTGFNGTIEGLLISFTTPSYTLGAQFNGNQTNLDVNDGYAWIKAMHNGVDKGFYLDYSTSQYYFGACTSGNQTNLLINDLNENITTLYNGNELGLKLDFATNVFEFGETGNNNYITINNASGYSEFIANSNLLMYVNYSGIILDTNSARLGDPDIRNNGTYIGIDDANQTLIASANAITTNNGTAIGQHLKINIGGTDYVIQLRLA
jgi:hypothetical protein